MCQMCEEYEAELRRMGLMAQARQVRVERHGNERRESVESPSQQGATQADAERRR